MIRSYAAWRNRRGMLFIELLLAVSMAVMIGVGIYRTFASGVAVWKRQSENRLVSDVTIFFDKLASDLRNYHKTNLTVFEATSQRLSFLIHNPDYRLLSKNRIPATEWRNPSPLVRVEYLYDAKSGTVKRRVYRFGDQTAEASGVVLAGMTSVGFAYYVPVRGRGVVLMAEANEVDLPRSVAVTIETTDVKGYPLVFRRNIELPVNR